MHLGRSSSLLSSLLLLLPLAACNNAIVVELQSGPQEFDLETSSLELPMELRDDSGGAPVVTSVDCSMTGICPPAGIAISCNESGLCDPDAVPVSVPVGDVVDFDALLSDAGTLLRFVDAIELVSVAYQVSPNSLTLSLPEVQIYWGPETAVNVDSAGVQLLGTIPTIPAATAVDAGNMAIDPDGSAAMSDFIVNTSRRVRFFAQTSVDVEPGDPFPAGSAHMTVNMRVRAIGRIIN
jgi:hypothetical protein